MLFKIGEVEITKEIADRFWSRVDIRGKEDCWEWQAGKNSKSGYNYGCFWIKGIGGVLTHRIAKSLSLGRWTTSEEILHSCDNPPCCNPNHLLEGTHGDNMRDRERKGRCNHERGVARHCAKLNDSKVRLIRKLHKLQGKYKKYTITYLAKKFGVDRVVVSGVIKGTAWKHVK